MCTNNKIWIILIFVFGIVNIIPTAWTPEATNAQRRIIPGSRIALQADTGKWFTRCRNCQKVVRNEFSDTITVHIDQPSGPYARFEVVDVGNGKIALKADTGKYVTRCRYCVRGAKDDFVTVHVTDPSAPYAQFTPVLLAIRVLNTSSP